MYCVTQDRWTELMKIPQKYPKIVPKKYEKSWLIGWAGGRGHVIWQEGVACGWVCNLKGGRGRRQFFKRGGVVTAVEYEFFFGSKLWRVGNISGKKMLQCFDNLFTRNPPWLIHHLLRKRNVYAPWRAFYEPAHQSACQPFCIALQNVPIWYKPPGHQLQSPA